MNPILHSHYIFNCRMQNCSLLCAILGVIAQKVILPLALSARSLHFCTMLEMRGMLTGMLYSSGLN